MSRPARSPQSLAVRHFPDEQPDQGGADPTPAPFILLVGQTEPDQTLFAAALRSGAVTLIAPSVQAARAWLGRAIERHTEFPQQDGVTDAPELFVDLASQQASWRKEPLGLTGLELRLLGALNERVGRVWSFADLSLKVWGSSHHGDRSMIRSAVQRLRRKLESAHVTFTVESIRAIGFRLCHSASERTLGRRRDLQNKLNAWRAVGSSSSSRRGAPGVRRILHSAKGSATPLTDEVRLRNDEVLLLKQARRARSLPAQFRMPSQKE